MALESNYEDVIEFNKKIIQLTPETTGLLTEERFKWFQGVCNEELAELAVALRDKDKIGTVDAIIDLIYFAYGRLYEIGLSPAAFQVCWNAVQKANMSKVRGNKGRGSDADAIKPEAWQSPEADFQLDANEALDVIYPEVADEKQCVKCGNYQDYDKCKDCVDTTSGTPSEFRPREELDFDFTPGAINVDQSNRKNISNSQGNEPTYGALAPNNGGPQDFINDIWPQKVKNNFEGMKFDDGKLPVGQFLRDFKYAILEVTKIWAFGAKKYAKGNWKFLENGEERYGDAEIRHFLDGDELDSESNILHAAHKAWNALAELAFILKRKNGGKI